MRTTLRIDDDVLEAAKSLARAERRSVGEVVSALARRGLAPRARLARDRGFPVFQISEDAAPLTAELVRDALEEP